MVDASHVLSLNLLFNVNLSVISPHFGITGDPRKKYRERLHLWQVFFGSPYEWWDNRNHKSNSKHPDFRHKSTGEALWLQATDPPWIRKQLEFLDGKMEEKDQHCHFGSDSSMSKWLYS